MRSPLSVAQGGTGHGARQRAGKSGDVWAERICEQSKSVVQETGMREENAQEERQDERVMRVSRRRNIKRGRRRRRMNAKRKIRRNRVGEGKEEEEDQWHEDEPAK